MEVCPTNCRSCLDPPHQGVPANTFTQTKMAQTHSTSENWPNSLDPQKSHAERSLASWKYIIYRRQRETQQPRQYEVKTRTGIFKIPAIRLAPKETEERLHNDDDSDEEEEEEEEEEEQQEAKLYTK